MIRNYINPAFALVAIPFVAFPAAPGDAGASASRPAPAVATLLPKPLTSFGACETGQWVYLFGGHSGAPHQYHRDSQNGDFLRMSALDGASWEVLPGGKPLQGVALVSHESAVYRIGGMAARNAAGEKSDLHSSDEFARFDVLRSQWRSLRPLPAPRSSHDAAILGSTLYVAGGWDLQGESPDAKWHDDLLATDLSAADPAWTAIAKIPQRRRGIALAAWSGRVAVIGGMTEDGELSRRVDLFDVQSKLWTRGPDLPEAGFGAACAIAAGSLVVNGRDGALLRLEGDRWVSTGSLVFPRYFHRLLSLRDGSLLAIGGTGAGGGSRVVERVAPAAAGAPQVAVLTIPFPGRAKNRQGVALRDHAVHWFGGNDSTEQHSFESHNFVDESWKLNLRTLQFSRLTPLPTPRQSLMGIADRDGAPAALFAGGFGFDQGRARTLPEIYQYSFEADRWTALGKLPEPRSQAGLVEWKGETWLFGGWDHDPSRPKGEESRFAEAPLRWQVEKGAIERADASVRMPRIRRAFGGVLLEGRYYMFGGLDGGFETVRECDVFDFAKQSWDTVPPPQVPRIGAEACALDGKIYLFGGTVPGDGDGGSASLSLEEFDPKLRAWRFVLAAVPNTTKQTRMLRDGNRLLFVSTNDERDHTLRLAWVTPGQPTPTATPSSAATPTPASHSK